jgi:hypothetical protein
MPVMKATLGTAEIKEDWLTIFLNRSQGHPGTHAAKILKFRQLMNTEMF